MTTISELHSILILHHITRLGLPRPARVTCPHAIGYWGHVCPSYLTWRRAHHPQLNMRIMGSQFVHSHHHLHSYSCSCSKCEQWGFWLSILLPIGYHMKFPIFDFPNCAKIWSFRKCFPLFCPSFHCVGQILFGRKASEYGCAVLCTVPLPSSPISHAMHISALQIFHIKILERRSVFWCDLLGNTLALIHVTRNVTPIVLGFIFSI